MPIPEIFRNLKLDQYYMVLIYVGAFLLILSFFIPIYWLTNQQLGLFAAGMFCIGLGEWKNHKKMIRTVPPDPYTRTGLVIEDKIRKPDAIGYILDLLGFVLFFIGLLNFFGVLK